MLSPKNPTSPRKVVLSTEASPESPPSFPRERRLARGFTITVSAPPEESVLEESPCDAATSRTEEPRQGRNWEPDYLTPGDISPELPLSRTESRLPSVEDMLADEEIRKMLETSENHLQVQAAILEEDEPDKYEALMLLVQKSYEEEQWRTEAAKDRYLIDTLVLYIRQRITEAQNPFQIPGGDFLGRSTRTLKSLSSRAMRRINTQSSDASRSTSLFVSASGSPRSFVRLTSLNETEQLQRAAAALALAGPAIKLLRNFCVKNKDCQIYLHEHRIVDLLMDHTDLISEVSYQVSDRNAQQSTGPGLPSGMLPSQTCCPQWVGDELIGLPRSLVQLVTNVVSGIPSIQAHVLQHIFPEALVKIIILSGDADLLACLLHCLTVQQSTSTIYDLLIFDSRCVQVWYLILSAALRQAEPDRDSIAYRRMKTTMPTADDKFQGEWLSLFVSSILKRSYENKIFFVEILKALIHSDVMSFRVIVPMIVLSHAAPSRSPSRSTTPSRRSSYESTPEWECHVHYQVDRVLVTSKPDVLRFFFSLIEALLDGELSQQPIRQEGLGTTFVGSPETLVFLLEYFDLAVDALDEPPDISDSNMLAYKKSFIPLVQILASLSAVSCLITETTIRDQFNEFLGKPLLLRILKLLSLIHQLQTSHDSKWERIRPALSRRDLLLCVANLSYKSPPNQQQLGLNQGIPLLLNFAHIDTDDPLMEQAALFALRNACQHGDNCTILKQLLQTEFRRIRSPDEIHQPEAVVIGKFETNDYGGVISRIEKIQ